MAQQLMEEIRMNMAGPGQRGVSASSCNNDRFSFWLMVWSRRTSVAPSSIGLSWRGPAPIMRSSAVLLFPTAWFMSTGALIWPEQTCSSDHRVGPETLALSPINELKKQKGTATVALQLFSVFSLSYLQALPKTLCCHILTKIGSLLLIQISLKMKI